MLALLDVVEALPEGAEGFLDAHEDAEPKAVQALLISVLGTGALTTGLY